MTDSTPRLTYRGHRGLWFLAALVLLVALAVTLLPFLIQYAIPRALHNAGIEEASVGNVDFNPFTGRFRLQDLDMRSAGEPVLRLAEVEVNIAWLPLFKRQILIQSILLDSSSLLIEQTANGRIRAAGFPTGSEQVSGQEREGDGRWSFGTGGGRLEDIDLTYRMPDLALDLHVDRMNIGPLYSWHRKQEAILELEGSLNGSPLAVRVKALPFDQPARYGVELRVQGLEIAVFQPLLRDSMQELAGRLSTDGRLDLTLGTGGSWEVVHEGGMHVEGLHAVSDGNGLDQDSIDWSGTTRLQAGPEIAIDGELQGRRLAAALPASNLALALGHWSWKGEVRHEPGESGATQQAQGNISLADARLGREDDGRDLLRFATLATDELQLGESRRLTLAGLRVNDLVVGVIPDGTDRAPVTVGELVLGESEWQPERGVSLASIMLKDLQAILVRDPDGNWPLLAAWQGVGDADAQARAPAEGEPGGGMPVRIGTLRIEADSSLSFRDEAVNPAFATRLEVEQASFGPLDTARPQAPAKLDLVARTGKYSSVDFHGEVRPFLEQPAVDLEGQLRSVDLHSLTAYTRQALGYDINTGSLDADIDLAISSGTIDAMNRLTLRNLQVKVADEKEAQQLQRKLSMPLDTALNMLRDGDDHIRLDLPVTGDIRDPKFELDDVIQTALAKATQKAAVGYLKYALQPYGAILSVAQMASEAASAVRLEPIRFVAGGEAVTPDSLDYLGKLGELLKQRPRLAVRLCGRAVDSDRTVLAAGQPLPDPGTGGKEPRKGGNDAAVPPPQVSDEALLELAATRSSALKDRLVSEYGVPPERLYICNPEIDPDAAAEPRVELMI